MSILIKGMEMPKGCAFCKISRRNGKKMICPFIWKCEWDIHDPMSADHRLDNCPLIPVPDHGRLIDADAVSLEGGPYEYDEWCKWALDQYQDAPTIIPSDKEERQ